MEREVTYRDYQKVQTADLNNMQDYARQSLDDIVFDAVTASLRFAGFNVIRSNTAEITVAAGRFYGANDNGQIGAVYTLPSQSIISMVQYLCNGLTTQKICTLAVYGVENITDMQNRDFIVDTTTSPPTTQPKSVTMTESRDALLTIVAGAESTAPTAPQLSVGYVGIANILVDANGVISITMLSANEVTSTEDLDSRLTTVETFDTGIGPRLTALASDLASLQNQLSNMPGSVVQINLMMQDIAYLKTQANLPASHSYYGASFFIWPDSTQFDTTNALSLGFNCDISYGVRFPAGNAQLGALSMFNTLDQNAAYDTGSGLLLPAYTSVLKLTTGTVTSSIAIGQYTYQTFSHQLINIPFMRMRKGPAYKVCTNGDAQQTAANPTATVPYWLPNFQTYQLSGITMNISGQDGSHSWMHIQNYFLDTWTQPYWVADYTTHTVSGALIAQSFLVASDTWVTTLGIYLQSVASPTDINLALVMCTNGTPDLTRTLFMGKLNGNSLHAGQVNYLTITPTFVEKGMRCAVVITSAANHQIGTTAAGSYLNGTFFYSMDSAYFLGDFTKELYLEVWGARFNSSQVAIQLNTLSLAGGIRDIDLTIRAQIPASCNLVYEVQPNGSGAWLPINDPATVPFTGSPILCNFRARFVGSPDVMPGIILPDSICKIWAPGPNFTLVTIDETLAAATTSLSMKVRVEGFSLQAHSLDATHGDFNGYIALYYGGPPKTRKNWSSLTYTLLDANTNTYELLATWTGIPSTSDFVLVIHGTTNDISNVFLVSSVVWWQ